MLFFMILHFPIQRIKAKSSLAQKLESLEIDPFLHRIFAKISFIRPDTSRSTPIRAIIDTGAVFSLFPENLLDDYPNIKTENHTLWGIIDTPECHITTKLAKIPIILIDMDGNESPKFNILAAFSGDANIPPILGMKGLLASYPSNIDIKNCKFDLKIDSD